MPCPFLMHNSPNKVKSIERIKQTYDEPRELLGGSLNGVPPTSGLPNPIGNMIDAKHNFITRKETITTH